MKKILLTVASLIITAVCVYGAGELLQPQTGSVPSQSFAPDGRYTTTVTNGSTVRNLSPYVHMAFISATTCKVRYLPSTSKTYTLYNRGFNNLSTTTYAYPTTTIVKDVWFYRGINRNTPFLNFTNCKSATLELQ